MLVQRWPGYKSCGAEAEERIAEDWSVSDEGGVSRGLSLGLGGGNGGGCAFDLAGGGVGGK